MPIHRRREKVFGPGRAVPLDRNAKARICRLCPRLERAGAPAGSAPAARSPAPSLKCWRRCCGASTTAAAATCFPSYEKIAEMAECARSTVAEALKALEWAGVLTWQNRITRILVRERDMFGQLGEPMAGDTHLQRLRVQRPEIAAFRRFSM